MSDDESTTDEGEDAALDAVLAAVAHAPRPARIPIAGELVGGRYRIEASLGRGGMGHVFAARDLRTEKSVALKWMVSTPRLGSDRDGRAALARFLREARIAAKVANPNVVDVYDVEVDGDAPYLVMERLRGETLRERLVRGPLSWDEALSVLRPAMLGVAALHRAGVVHRDLKPDNIFLCAPGEGVGPTTKVLDLGISREPDEGLDGLTRTGALLGTPAYMPLEQLRASKDVGPRADVYALGVVLYEALSGERPFEARSAADLAVVLATERPKPLGERVPAIAGARAEVVMKALAREPEGRFESVDAFVAALTSPAPSSRGASRWFALALAVLALSAGLAWQQRRAAPRVAAPVALPAVVGPVPAQASSATVTPVPAIVTPPVDSTPTTAARPRSSSAVPRSARAPRSARPVPPPPAAEEPSDSALDRATSLRPEDFR